MDESGEICPEADAIVQDLPRNGRLFRNFRFIEDKCCDKSKPYDEGRKHLRRVPREANAAEGKPNDGKRYAGNNDGVATSTMRSAETEGRSVRYLRPVDTRKFLSHGAPRGANPEEEPYENESDTGKRQVHVYQV